MIIIKNLIFSKELYYAKLKESGYNRNPETDDWKEDWAEECDGLPVEFSPYSNVGKCYAERCTYHIDLEWCIPVEENP